MRELYHRINIYPFFSNSNLPFPISFHKYLSFSLLIISAFFLLQGCQTSGNNNYKPWIKSTNTPIAPAQQTPNDLSVTAVQRQNLGAPASNYNNNVINQTTPVKVAILLPLSGTHAKLGNAMLNAAQMAVFDVAHNNFELLPFDTKGNPDKAREAAQKAIKESASLILGPVFSPCVKAASQITQRNNINMIAFSTDWTLANRQTFLIGFLPFDQIERIISYATFSGYKNIGVISPMDKYGNSIIAAYKSISQRAGVESSYIEQFSKQEISSLSSIMRKFTNYDARKANLTSNKSNSLQSNQLPFDAVLMPVGGSLAREIGSFLNHYDLPPEKVKRLGTGLMDDHILAQDKSLNLSWFAAPEPKSRRKFESHFQSFYNYLPPRLASLSYDATALAAILARINIQQHNTPIYDYTSLTNPNGFSGVDGIFRFRADGIVERGLAILEYKNGRIVVIDKAPKTFQRLSY